MNLNTRVNKATAVAVPVVLIVLYTIAFFLLKNTPVLITAYVVAIIGSILFCAGNLYFIGSKGGYPWMAAIPMTLWRYIITSTLLSAVFVIAENVIPNLRISYLVVLIGHILVFAFFFVMLMLMHTGKEIIREADERVAVKRGFIKELGVDLAAAKEAAPGEVKKDIEALIEAVRYSDPMSHASLSPLENDIADNVTRLRQQTEPEKIRELCVTLTRQIKERNAKTKTLK